MQGCAAHARKCPRGQFLRIRAAALLWLAALRVATAQGSACLQKAVEGEQPTQDVLLLQSSVKMGSGDSTMEVLPREKMTAERPRRLEEVVDFLRWILRGHPTETMLVAYSTKVNTPFVFQFSGPYFMTCLTTLVVWTGLGVLCWQLFFFRSEKPVKDEGSKANPEDTFETGHFQCCENPMDCVCALFFPCLQWPDNLDTAQLFGFWKAFALLSVLVFANMIFHMCIFIAVWIGPFTACAFMYFRQELRRKLDLSPWTCPSCCFDCVYVSICPFLAIVQDKRVIKEAYEVGHSGFV